MNEVDAQTFPYRRISLVARGASSRALNNSFREMDELCIFVSFIEAEDNSQLVFNASGGKRNEGLIAKFVIKSFHSRFKYFLTPFTLAINGESKPNW